MQLAPGTSLDGYEIQSLLGTGGMGEVYRARDLILKREVAIKVLPSSVAQNPDRLRRFELEAQAAAALDHPNILAIHRYGIFQGAPYLVSELLEGQTLRQMLQHGPVSARTAIDTNVQVAHGLAAAHEKGIVHRDIKPENLFVLENGRVKILDFGLAKLTEPTEGDYGSGSTLTHATSPGVIMGTVGYMSPEQIRGTKIDHRADIFALGSILYEMLSGRRAFHKSTAAETMTAILSEDPPSLSQLVKTTPPGLQRIVQRCLERNPEQRFQSVSDLAFALEALSDSRVGPSEDRASETKRRFKIQPSMAIIAGVILIAVTLIVVAISRREPATPVRVTEYKQVTHAGSAGAVGGTDGSRLYLYKGISDPIQEVAISGGEIESLHVALPNPYLNDVSPDGSTLLVQSYAAGLSDTAPIYTVRIVGGAQRFLVNAAGALWSPDGQHIYYTTASGDFFKMGADGSGSRKLASLGKVPENLAISPNEKTIRFTKDNQYWEMSVDGSKLHQIIPQWHPNNGKCCGTWSGDGNFFFFIAGPHAQIWALDERKSLFRPRAQEPFQLTSNPLLWTSLVLSKGGNTLFSSGSTRRGELVRYDSTTKHYEPYLNAISASLLSFSKDGQTVAYVSYPEGDLWKANRDGSGRVQLTFAPTYPDWVSLSPDGSQIIFMDESSHGREQAWVMSSQGGTPSLLLPDAPFQQTDPSWSPDGTKVIFATNLRGGVDMGKGSSIRILDLATHKEVTLPDTGDKFSPHWSPDGQLIEASSLDLSSMYIFDLKSQHWSLGYKGIFAYANWSNDSQSLYLLRYSGTDPAVLKQPINGSPAEVVADLSKFHLTGHFGLWLGLDPANEPLLLRDVGSDDVYALTLQRN